MQHKQQHLTKKSGIYQIRNQKNNKIYIGSSVSIIKRYWSHTHMLINNKHTNIHLQRAWNMYDEPGSIFIFEILELCEIEKLIKREQYYLNKLLKAQDYIINKNNYFLRKGYNILPYSDSRLGTKQTVKSIKKAVMNNPNRKPISCFDLTGKFINHFDSCRHASRELKLSHSAIRSCCIGDSKYCDKYYFVYKKDYNNKKNYINSLKLTPINTNSYNKNKKYSKKEIYKQYSVKITNIFDIYGNLIKTFKSRTDCTEYLNSTKENISKYINKFKLCKNYFIFDSDIDNKLFLKHQKEKYNYLFKMKKQYNNIIYVYDMYGDFINSFENIKQCVEILQMNYNGILNVLHKRRKTYKKFKFIYREDIV